MSVAISHGGSCGTRAATSRVTNLPSRLNDPKYIQNTVKNHITSMLSEEQLVHELHTNTNEIVVNWGHHISTNGNDVITYNPATKRVSLWDDKVTRRVGSAKELRMSPAYRNDRVIQAAIKDARDKIRNSELADDDIANAISAINKKDVSMFTHGAGNYRDNLVEKKLKKENKK
jgi:hypothetical protein